MEVYYVIVGAREGIDLPIYEVPVMMRENMLWKIFEKFPVFKSNYHYFLRFNPRIFRWYGRLGFHS